MSNGVGTDRLPSKESDLVSGVADSRSELERHLHRMDVFKVSLRNSFGLDLRTLRHRTMTSVGISQVKPFQYLPELLPFLEPRVNVLGRSQRAAFETIKEHAIESFWKLYADFLPLTTMVAKDSGLSQFNTESSIDGDCLSVYLARAILLFDSSRGTKFVTYLDKCLREAVKNIRGERLARQLSIPVSAGRMVHQITWLLQQAEFECRRRLSAAESDGLVIAFLTEQRARFSEATMQRVAFAIRQGRTVQSIERCRPWLDPAHDARRPDNAGNDCYVEEAEEHERQLHEIDEAIARARFTASERAIVLHRLDLPHDSNCLEQLSDKITSATLRKRSTRLLLRLVAARFAPQAPHFGWLVETSPAAARQPLRQVIEAIARRDHPTDSVAPQQFVSDLLNSMAISDSIYRITISERGHLERYLLPDTAVAAGSDRSVAAAERRRLSTLLFGKLKAALIEQERQGFPLRSD
ncbi:hypothetical protein [Roseiconus lacunae]|uniref:hypothetical protein n=1 Tax=Roseiconus lacunae TaxID=2605694 RepID=UPI001E3120D4|nr:hypothetical protein [Roseiconus lacunae]MCD0460743.1 hypothetical protein [Roseiconus lacunae]